MTKWVWIIFAGFLIGTVRGQTTKPIPELTDFAMGPRTAPDVVRTQFEEIEKIARLPADQQSTQVPRLYLERLVPMSTSVQGERMISSSLPPQKVLEKVIRSNGLAGDYVAELESVRATMTPQQVADLIISNYGMNILHLVALERLKAILLAHHDVLINLIDTDLAADDLTARRAFWAINQMKMSEYVDRMMTILIAGGPRADQARNAIGWLRDPAAAKPLLDDLENHPQAMPRYKYLLRVVLHSQPANQTMVKLLDSPDGAVRAGAALVLEEAEDESVVPIIPRLMSDVDTEVRQSAVRKIFRLAPQYYLLVRDEALRALSSPDVFERVEAALGFVGKNDPAGAKVLLVCMKDPNLPSQLRGRVANGEARLMQTPGRRGGSPLRLSMASWGPGDSENAAEIAAFEEWIKENVDARK